MIGVFLLSIGATSCSYGYTNDLCIPSVVFWVSMLSGPFTGAQFNLMVTLTWVFRRHFKIPYKFYLVYIGSQILGAFFAGIILYFLHSNSLTMYRLDKSSLNLVS
jgi:glycerol uptake facilitator-like aquaporin